MNKEKKQDLLKQAHENMSKLYSVEQKLTAATMLNAKSVVGEYVAINRQLLANLFNLLASEGGEK